jgi:6-phosphogluconolactonase
MLRTIGLMTGLAFLMVACGGGGDSGPPAPASYTVGGTVTGLAGSGLVLQNSGGDDLPISASGAFTFATGVPSGTSFAVTVRSSPTSPLQVCSVTDGVGTIAAADVKNVDVTCMNGYTVGGTVSGLTGFGLVLQIFRYSLVKGHPPYLFGPPLRITSNGPFTFDIVYPEGAFSVATFAAISQQPASPSQICLIHNADITRQAANVTDIEVGCSQYSYVANAEDNTVSAYTVDATSGALAAVGTPVKTGTTPHAIVGTQDRQYVFVGNEGSNDISAFAVNFASGALTAVPGSPFAAGTDPKALALYREPFGIHNLYLYVANAGSDTVSGYYVDTSSGSLGPLSPATMSTGRRPASIAVDSTLGIIYIANNGGSNDISAFWVDGGTGTLTPVAGSPFPAGANPISLALGATGRFLYTANPDATNPSISGFSIDPASGALSPLSGSPFPLAVSHYIAADQTGAYLYVTRGASIVGYGIYEPTGALTALAGFPVSAGANAYSITIDPTNQFLYVTNDGAANVSGFTLDAASGALTSISGSPFPAGNHPEFLATF